MIFWSKNIQRRPNHHLSDLSKNEDCVDLVLTLLEGIIPLFFFKEFWLSLISFLPALLLYWIYFVVARIV